MFSKKQMYQGDKETHICFGIDSSCTAGDRTGGSFDIWRITNYDDDDKSNTLYYSAN